MPTPTQALKRLLLGRPLASEEAAHQLLPKTLALPVFASDPLSSNAYATEEILIVLAAAGAASFWLVTPLSILIAAVVIIVIISYRQTIYAYPRGGGSYMVARENLGTGYGLIAAAALLADYTLTVAVSIAAGVAAIASAAPAIGDVRVPVAVGFIILVMLANLRGMKESGVLFAIPTYTFVFSIWLMLAVGITKCIGGCPQAATAELEVPATTSLSLFLILRAFASGSTALTGIEAVADGVGAFRGRRPREQARNAAMTLSIMGMFTLTMFLGISFLARATGVHAIPHELAHQLGVEEKTVVAQIAEAVFGGGFLFYFVQATTAGILILAANTAYADFPRLSSILARDRFMPRQFMNRGDRLVFSNGVVVLSVFAALLIWAFDASVNALIQLYVVGVFTTFTLSQAGMVARWRRLQPPGYRRKMALNFVGATTTGIVLVVVSISKFTHGAWITIVAIVVIVFALRAIHNHYASVAQQLRLPGEATSAQTIGTRAVILVGEVDEPALRAAGYARALRPLELRALYIGAPGGERNGGTQRAGWETACPMIPLDTVEARGRDTVAAVRAYVRSVPRGEGEFVTVILPEVRRRGGWGQLISRRRNFVIKAALLFEPDVVVTDVPAIVEREPQAQAVLATRGPIAPPRIIALVLVSAVHNATQRAVAYARALSPTELTAITFNVDPDETTRIMHEWMDKVTEVPLEVVDSPFREVTRPLVKHVRRLRAEQPDAVVSVVIPEFVVKKWWHQFLHNQSALAIKAALLFEPGVVVTSVPYHLR